MAKRLIPSFNRILVEKIIPPSKTNSGILLPEKTPKLNSGKVVAVGPGARDRDGKLIPVNLKEGDTVLLPEYGGTEVKLGQKESFSTDIAILNLISRLYPSLASVLSGDNKVSSQPSVSGISYTETMISWEHFMTDLKQGLPFFGELESHSNVPLHLKEQVFVLDL
ncbi:hypothetical protein DITRI_Ditri05aG0079200 [Diplodiscus trichospermus]